MGKQKLGILGGTFDPVHAGHVQMAQCALDHGAVDQLLMMPTGNPPYKDCFTPQEDRWKMLVAACAQDERLIPSRIEMDREGPVYTVDTLREVLHLYPRADVYYLIGSDAVMKLKNWRGVKEVLSLCRFLVCPRTTEVELQAFRHELAELTAMGGRFTILPMDPVNVSSTEVRTTAMAGLPAPNLCVSVREYIAARGLYGHPRRIRESEFWLDQLFTALNPHRFAHSLSVAFTARQLARLHGVNPVQAEQGGLLHDCAKCLPVREMQRIAREHALTDDPAILASGALLHSLVGAWVARNQYHMADPEVLESIAYHNTGFPGMSRLSMCVCLADFMEPNRGTSPLLERVRLLSQLSLERALLLSLEGTADYVLSRGKALHPRTQDTITWLKSLPDTGSPPPAKAAKRN